MPCLAAMRSLRDTLDEYGNECGLVYAAHGNAPRAPLSSRVRKFNVIDWTPVMVSELDFQDTARTPGADGLENLRQRQNSARVLEPLGNIVVISGVTYRQHTQANQEAPCDFHGAYSAVARHVNLTPSGAMIYSKAS